MNPNLVQVLSLIVLGWTGGALVNYLADVLPWRRRLAAPFCLYCEARMPVGAYAFWPRRCESCGRRRGLRVWLVEAAMILATVWLWFRTPPRLDFASAILLLVFFALVVVIDIEHHLILHVVSLAGVVVGLFAGVRMHGWLPTLAGGAAGFFLMLGLYYLGIAFTRWMARRRGQQLNTELGEDEGLGFGDVNLAGVMGLILGWPGIIAGLLSAALLSGAVSLVYVVILLAGRRYTSAAALPYGPFLVLGAALLLVMP